jgi:hypothetical protein
MGVSARSRGERHVETVQIHEPLTVRVAHVTDAAQSWLRIRFRNGGRAPVTIVSVEPFVGVCPGARRKDADGFLVHIWPESIDVDPHDEELPVLVQPGEVRRYAFTARYALERAGDKPRGSRRAGDRLQVDYFLRLETESSEGERRMSSFRYAARIVGARAAPGRKPRAGAGDFPPPRS